MRHKELELGDQGGGGDVGGAVSQNACGGALASVAADHCAVAGIHRKELGPVGKGHIGAGLGIPEHLQIQGFRHGPQGQQGFPARDDGLLGQDTAVDGQQAVFCAGNIAAVGIGEYQHTGGLPFLIGPNQHPGAGNQILQADRGVLGECGQLRLVGNFDGGAVRSGDFCPGQGRRGINGDHGLRGYCGDLIILGDAVVRGNVGQDQNGRSLGRQAQGHDGAHPGVNRLPVFQVRKLHGFAGHGIEAQNVLAVENDGVQGFGAGVFHQKTAVFQVGQGTPYADGTGRRGERGAFRFRGSCRKTQQYRAKQQGNQCEKPFFHGNHPFRSRICSLAVCPRSGIL